MNLKTLTLGILLLTSAAAAEASTKIEKKIMQFGGPEMRINSATNEIEFYQHEIFFVVEGPVLEESLQTLLKNSIESSLVAAVTAATVTPGEVAIKTAAAYAAFKVALLARLSVSGALMAIRGEISISIREKGAW